MVGEHLVLHTLHVSCDMLAICALCVKRSSPARYITWGQLLFKIRTIFYKSLGEAFAVDAALAKDGEKFWG